MKRNRKKVSICLVIVLFLLLFYDMPVTSIAEVKADYEINNPRIDENGLSIWDCVYFGRYWQEDTNSDGIANESDDKEPIKWRVLSLEDNTALLLADKNLDFKSYHSNLTDNVNWENSALCSWLNSEFIKEAFNDEERNAISNMPEFGGQVYLLSQDEVCNPNYGFDKSATVTDHARQSQTTMYAKTHGKDNNEYDAWWTRTRVTHDGEYPQAVNVKEDGAVNSWGCTIHFDNMCTVRPCLYLDLSKADIWSYAGTVKQNDFSTVKQYDFSTDYTSKDSDKKPHTGQIRVKFNENELSTPSNEYNHNIATFCSILSTMAYDESNGFNELMKKMDYEYGKNYVDNEGDSICYSLANKTVLLDGKQTDIVLVVMRGTYNMEWVDNFDPGTGKNHKGFQKGADVAYSALKDYISEKGIGNDGKKVKIIVTGHSRGAAVANLLGKEILDKGGLFLKDAGDLFDYSFATPNSTSLEERKNEKYDGIFSIVNPEDFVTKVMLSKNWNYGRYGRTLVLPSSSTDSATWYKKFLSRMRGYFKKYRPYDAYEPYPKGTNTVSGYVNLVAQTVPSVNRYYYQSLANPWDLSYIMKMGNTLKKLYTDFLGYNQCNNKVYEVASYATLLGAVAGDYGFLGQSTAAYFFVNQKIDRRFEWAHLSETYLASMKALEAEDLYKNGKPVKRTVKKVMVNCPVDVSISNGEGEVVGEIVDNKIVTDIEGDSVNLSVIGDSKQFWISADEDCHVTLTGNDDGSMDYILSEEDADSGETQRILYKTVPIQNDRVYTSELLGDEGIAEAKLQDAAGDVVDKSEELGEEDLGDLSVTVQIEGVGMADSYNNLSYGDCVVLSAVTDVNNSFLGWYDSENNLVSTESEYPVIVTENMNYTAKFTDVIVSPTELNTAQKLAMSSGEMHYLEAVLLPENVTCPDVSYESSDETIVSVTEDGILEAKSKGIAEITVKSQMDDTVQSICKVTVDLPEENPDTSSSKPSPTAGNKNEISIPPSFENKVTAPAKGMLKKYKNKKGKKISLSWKKIKDAKGYQIQYADNKKFKKKKSKLTKKTKYTIKKLKKKKTYYIRVRAYKLAGSKKVYGSWSKVKKVKVKK